MNWLNFKTSRLIVFILLAIFTLAGWAEGHQPGRVIQDGTLNLQQKAQLEEGKILFDESTVEIETLIIHTVEGGTIEVDLTDYTKRDGTQQPTGDWDFNDLMIYNASTVEAEAFEGDGSAIENVDAATFNDLDHTFYALVSDLLNYYEKADLYNTEEIRTILEDYYTTSEIDDALDNKMDLLVGGSVGNFLENGGSGQAADSGKSPDDFLAVDGTDAMEGDLDLALNDIVNGHKATFDDTVECQNLHVLNTAEIGGTSAKVWYEAGDGALHLKDDNIETSVTEIAAEIDNRYTKAETDSTIETYTYSKSEVDTALANFALDDLADVEAGSPEDGQALVWDEGAGDWVPGASGKSTAEIEGIIDDYSYNSTEVYTKAEINDWGIADLDDTDIVSPLEGQMLKYNGSDWENSEEILLMNKVEAIGTGDDIEDEFYFSLEPIGDPDIYFDTTHVPPSNYTITPASKLITFTTPPYDSAVITASYEYVSDGIVSLPIKTVYFSPDWDSDYGDYRARNVGGTRAFSYTFMVPPDFSELVSINYVAISTSTATGTVDLYSDYAAPGENYAQHSESDIGGAISVTDSQMYDYDISPVFSQLDAGDFAGIEIDFNGGIGYQKILGIVLQYK